MVKINKSLKKELISTIKINKKRYISLIAIIFLGVGFFVGMKSSAPALQDTMINYFKEKNYMDVEVISLIGITDEELNKVKENVKDVKEIEGGYYEDVVVHLINKKTQENIQSVISVNSYDPNKKINKVKINEGREPINTNECMLDASIQRLGYKIGDTIEINATYLEKKTLTITGFVRSPGYISVNKGTSSLLSGTIDYFMYVNESTYDHEDGLYTVGYITLNTKYKAFTDEYNEYVTNIKKEIENISLNITKDRREKLFDEKTKEIEAAEKEYNTKKEEVEKELLNAKKQIEDGEKQIQDAESKIMTDTEIDIYLASAKNSLDTAKAQLDSSKTTLDVAKKILSDTKNTTGIDINIESPEIQLSFLKSKLDELKKLLETHKNFYDKSNNKLRENDEKCLKLRDENLISACYKVSEKIQLEINEEIDTINSIEQDINQLLKLIDYIENFEGIDANIGGQSFSEYEQYIKDLENDYNNALKKYNQSLNDYNNATKNLKPEMAKARQTIKDKKEELEKGKILYQEKEKEAKTELEKAYNQILDAKKLIKNLLNKKWYVLSRIDNYGYSQYNGDIERIKSIGKILPVLFFLVAALVTASSITRMAKEERSKIGVLKSLGYNNKQVMYKYIIYTLTALIFGSILGIALGTYIFPRVFAKVYSLMYFIPDIKYMLYFKYVLLSLFLAFISTVIVAYFTVKDTLKEKPYYLMRPKAEEYNGKTLLEKNKKLWKKIPFMKKVSYRNILRSIKRSLMTVLGVAGCASLIVASFGTRDAISDVIFLQYGKIFDISAEFFYKEDITDYEMREEQQRIDNLDEIANTVLGRIEMVDFKANNKTYSIYNIIPDDTAELSTMLYFDSTTDNNELELTNNGVILTEKIAKLIGAKVGDTVEYIDPSNDSHKVLVTGITENYIYHYMYMTKELYKEINEVESVNNSLFIKYADGTNEDLTNALINETEMFSSYMSLKDAQDSYDEIIEKFNLIILVIIISAGLLAFVVLYNLAKINISERLREIATLKVLGFRPKEVNKYINNEMTLLTVLGIILGLFGGYFLTEIVVTTCEVDNMMYYHGLSYTSYIYAILLTFIFSKVINWMVRRDLKKISMIESLKSME